MFIDKQSIDGRGEIRLSNLPPDGDPNWYIGGIRYLAVLVMLMLSLSTASDLPILMVGLGIIFHNADHALQCFGSRLSDQQGCHCGLTGTFLEHRSLPPVFESRRGHIWRVFHLWLRFITFGCRTADLVYHVHKSGRKTPIMIIIYRTSIKLLPWEKLS